MVKWLIVFLLIATPAWAVTDEQLRDAESTLRKMDGKISILRGYVQRAFAGKVEGITLTTQQKQSLKDSYIAEKGELVVLFNQLP